MRKQRTKLEQQYEGLQQSIHDNIRTNDRIEKELAQRKLKDPKARLSDAQEAAIELREKQIEAATAKQDEIRAKIDEIVTKADDLTGRFGGEERWKETRFEDLGKIDPCFPAGTTVLTPTGLAPIESLAVGDEVLAAEPHGNGALVVSRVTAVSRNWARRLILIDVGERIAATANHPFWEECSGEWKRADALRVGATLRGRAGPVVVTALDGLSGAVATFNIEVEGLHTYLVGAGGLLVHNGPSGFADPARKVTQIYRIEVTKDVMLGGVQRRAGETIYIGKTWQGGPGDVVKRFEGGHLRTRAEWNAIRDSIKPVLLKEGDWTRFETACWEQHFIEMHGGIQEGSPLVNIDNALDTSKFDAFKEGFGHNPCGG